MLKGTNYDLYPVLLSLLLLRLISRYSSQHPLIFCPKLKRDTVSKKCGYLMSVVDYEERLTWSVELLHLENEVWSGRLILYRQIYMLTYASVVTQAEKLRKPIFRPSWKRKWPAAYSSDVKETRRQKRTGILQQELRYFSRTRAFPFIYSVDEWSVN